MQEPEISPVSPMAMREFFDEDRIDLVLTVAEAARKQLDGRRVWCINSTASGGGVAEMLAVDLAYVCGVGIEGRWLVMDGNPDFFALTKRIHNRLHGVQGDDGELGDAERRAYEKVVEDNLAELRRRIEPDDIVILHDPQPAGLAPALAEDGIPVVWRCHVGRDEGNEYTEQAWDFLRPYVEAAPAVIFSRKQYIPDWVDPDKATVIMPSIDPFATKNRPMELDTARAILAAAGLVTADESLPDPAFTNSNGKTGRVQRQATVRREGPPPSIHVPLLVQVSRWDRLKDMAGVLKGFVEHVIDKGDDGDEMHLVLAGPDVIGVTDDPEGQEVWDECAEIWEGLPERVRRCVTLACLPMEDSHENAAIVNALQRHASVVTQKSLVEGFGLTCAEAMWKMRPVIASAVGGLTDQVIDGETGLLLQDPTDLASFGQCVRDLMTDLDRAQRFGEAAAQRVLDTFLPDRQLMQWAEVVGKLGIFD